MLLTMLMLRGIQDPSLYWPDGIAQLLFYVQKIDEIYDYRRLFANGPGNGY